MGPEKGDELPVEPEKKICPFCGEEMESSAGQMDGRECCQDCLERVWQQNLLTQDPVIRKWNDRYAYSGLVRLLAGAGALGLLFFMKAVLDYGWPDGLGILCLVTIPFLLLGFLVCCIIRGVCRGKLKKLIAQRELERHQS